MARSTFGGTSSDWVYRLYRIGSADLVDLNSRGDSGAPVPVTFWDAPVDGTQYDDLLLDDTPVTSIPAQEYGQVPEFEGPDGVEVMWAQAGSTPHRFRMVPQGKQGPPGEGGPEGPQGPPGYNATDAAEDQQTIADYIEETAGSNPVSEALSATFVAPSGKTTAGAAAPIPSLNVRDYGAVVNGTTDDSGAIQAAIDACPPGGAVVIPPGLYRMSSPLLIDKALKVDGGPGGRGPGALSGTCLYFDDGLDGIVVDVGDGTDQEAGAEIGPIKLRSRSRVGGATTTTGIGLHVINKAPRMPLGITVEYFGSHGIFLNGDSDAGGGQSNGCYGANVRVTGCGGDGIRVQGSDSNAHVFIGATVVANHGWGINIDSGASNKFYGVHADQTYHSSPGAIRDDGISNSFYDVYSEGGAPVLLDTTSNCATVTASLYARPAITDNSSSGTASVYQADWGYLKSVGPYGGPGGSRFEMRADVLGDHIFDLTYKGAAGGSNPYSVREFARYDRSTEEWTFITELVSFGSSIEPRGTKIGAVDVGRSSRPWRDLYASGRAVLSGSLPVFDVPNKPTLPDSATVTAADIRQALIDLGLCE